MIDGTWKYMDDAIPENMNVRPDTEHGNEVWTEYVRFAQWMHMIGTADKYQALCRAAQHYEESNVAEKVQLVCRAATTKSQSVPGEAKTQALLDAVLGLEREMREAAKPRMFSGALSCNRR